MILGLRSSSVVTFLCLSVCSFVCSFTSFNVTFGHRSTNFKLFKFLHGLFSLYLFSQKYMFFAIVVFIYIVKKQRCPQIIVLFNISFLWYLRLNKIIQAGHKGHRLLNIIIDFQEYYQLKILYIQANGATFIYDIFSRIFHISVVQISRISPFHE